MATPKLVQDFKEFLKSLNSNGVEYLLIGGYAAAIHGYVRATNDLDVWVKISPENAASLGRTLRQFESKSISGVQFGHRYAECEFPVISLNRLRENKAASARAKDLADLESLPT